MSRIVMERRARRERFESTRRPSQTVALLGRTRTLASMAAVFTPRLTPCLLTVSRGENGLLLAASNNCLAVVPGRARLLWGLTL